MFVQIRLDVGDDGDDVDIGECDDGVGGDDVGMLTVGVWRVFIQIRLERRVDVERVGLFVTRWTAAEGWLAYLQPKFTNSQY